MNLNDKRPIIQSNGYNGKEPTRVCPHCNKEKPISAFGFRKMKPNDENSVRNQSWCKECRSNSTFHGQK